MNDTLIAVDLAKAVFEIALSYRPGKVAQRERLARAQFLGFFVQRPPATVVMEACGSAHYWAREIERLGHHVVLPPPHHVRPYERANKTDRTDAKGLLEAYRNDDICPVPVKPVALQVLSTLHRLRSARMAEHTARINTLRGLLREMGVVIPVGAQHVVPQARQAIEDADSAVPVAVRPLLAEACDEIGALQERVGHMERQLEALAEQTPLVERLRSIPGSAC